jgi:hypothetical protein
VFILADLGKGGTASFLVRMHGHAISSMSSQIDRNRGDRRVYVFAAY